MPDGSQQLDYFLHGASKNDNNFYVIINAAVNDVEFGLHEGTQGNSAASLIRRNQVVVTSTSTLSPLSKNASLTVLGQSVVLKR